MAKGKKLGDRAGLDLSKTRSGLVYSKARVQTCLPNFDLEALFPDDHVLNLDELSELPSSYAGAFDSGNDNATPDFQQNPSALRDPSKKRTRVEDVVDEDEECPGRDHVRRRLARNRQVKAHGYTLSKRVLEGIVESACERSVNLDSDKLPASSCGYQAQSPTDFDVPGKGTLGDYLKAGFTREAWDGITPMPFQDRNGRIIMVLAGRPRDGKTQGRHSLTFTESSLAVAQQIIRAGDEAQFTEEELIHRRGRHGLGLKGIFHGNGTKKPCNLRMGRLTGILEDLCNDAQVQRMANFASSCFKIWAPRVFEEYQSKLHRLRQHDPALKTPFEKSVYPCVGFNFGPRVCTVPHRDHLNVPHGWCAIQSFGDFDHTRGGHLVIHDLRLVIDFPAGSVILIPSATLTHSNTPVAPGETRVSMTQFCPGGLFRFIDNDFQTQDELRWNDKKAYDKMMAKKQTRWKEGLGRLSTMAELRARAEARV